MFLYTVLTALVGVVAGILLATRTKKAEGVTYGKPDKAGRITNIVMIPVYMFLSPFCMFIGMICNPAYDGFRGFWGWVVSVVIASATLFCGLGLGASVALRKKGRSKLSFAAQFLGVVSIAIACALFMIFYGNLLKPLN